LLSVECKEFRESLLLFCNFGFDGFEPDGLGLLGLLCFNGRPTFLLGSSLDLLLGLFLGGCFTSPPDVLTEADGFPAGFAGGVETLTGGGVGVGCATLCDDVKIFL